MLFSPTVVEASKRPPASRRARIGTLVGCLLAAGAGCEGSHEAAQDPAPAEKRVATAPANGFNDDIAWRGLSEGLDEAKAAGRPLMMVVHASWCPQCKALKPKFHEPELARLSERFVMINVDQDLAPESGRYSPDGDYVPRIVFLDPTTLEVDEALRNPRRSRHLFYYHRSDDLVAIMRKALDRHGRT